jgi:predicted metalloprotease
MHDPDSSKGERHMDIRGRNRSSNIEDRRGMSPVRKGVGLSIGGVLFLIVLSLFGINPLPFLGVATKQPEVQMQQSPQPYQESAEEKELADVAGVTLAETEVTWNRLFEGRYPAPTMVMYNELTPTGCGTGQAAMGPFYCPLDQKVYVDLTFFRELEQKFGAPGDFAQAYVIAHEVGHHVQHLTGAADKVRQAQQRAGSKAQANQYSVMLELQADCYAGVWARDAAQRLQITQQDIEEGMQAASAIGDDRLQRASQGRVVPDAFTHGTSEQRMRWLMTGMNSGDPNACDTFNARNL